MHTLEGNVQATLRDIPPIAVQEALKVQAMARPTRDVHKLQVELAYANIKAKAADKPAQELHDTFDDNKR